MDTKMQYQIGSIYFGIFGILILCFGLIELLLGMTGGCIENGLIIFCNQEDFLLWRGIILTSAGLFCLSSIKNFQDIHSQAKTLMACLMIWVVGGIGLLGTLLGAIPGPEDGAWFTTWADFIGSFAGPYIPEVILLPFSLVILFFIVKRHKISGGQ